MLKLLVARNDKEDGFTLIEILVVILIIGILTAIAVPVFLNQRKTANDAAVQSDAKNAVNAVYTYIAANKGKQVPITASAIRPLMGGSTMGVSAGTGIAVSGHTDDFCVLAQNANSNLSSWNVDKKFVYFNSKNGGWQDNSLTLLQSTSCSVSTGNNANWTYFYG